LKPGGFFSGRLRTAIFAVMLIALGALAAVYVVYRRGIDPGADLMKKLPSGTSLSIENLRHTAARHGRTEWELSADTTRMMPGKNAAALDRVAVVFYMDDGSRVNLTADSGVLETGTSNLTVAGNVVVSRSEYRLTTERIRYRHQERILAAETPVTVSGVSMSLTADAATFDLDTRKLRFEGGVHGSIDQKLEM
jgi:LPS export ABC transporter protein LptC